VSQIALGKLSDKLSRRFLPSVPNLAARPAISRSRLTLGFSVKQRGGTSCRRSRLTLSFSVKQRGGTSCRRSQLAFGFSVE
jgi:hypothetical protein